MIKSCAIFLVLESGNSPVNQNESLSVRFFRSPMSIKTNLLFMHTLGNNMFDKHIPDMHMLREVHFDGLVQDCSISIANALQILHSCTELSICKIGQQILTVLAEIRMTALILCLKQELEALKSKCHFGDICITGCNRICHFDNLLCSQWQKCHHWSSYQRTNRPNIPLINICLMWKLFSLD